MKNRRIKRLRVTRAALCALNCSLRSTTRAAFLRLEEATIDRCKKSPEERCMPLDMLDRLGLDPGARTLGNSCRNGSGRWGRSGDCGRMLIGCRANIMQHELNERWSMLTDLIGR
jgi:hypothetical protein